MKATDPSGLVAASESGTLTGVATGLAAGGVILTQSDLGTAESTAESFLEGVAALSGVSRGIACNFFKVAVTIATSGRSGGGLCGTNSVANNPDEDGVTTPTGGSGGGGQCTPERQRELQEEKNRACNQKRSCRSGRGLISDQSQVLSRIANGQACVAARERINNECFLGGDKPHQRELQNARDVLNICLGAG